MILGTQWYILFNVIAGAAAFPGDLQEASSNFRVGGLAVVAPGDPAGHLPVLRHRRDHRVRRRVERGDRGRGGELGQTKLARTGSAPTSPTPTADGNTPRWCSASR